MVLVDTIIPRLFTTQTALIAHAHAHWLWACLLAPASFLAFQLDGIFVGATRGQEMRNAMIVSASGLTVCAVVFGCVGVAWIIGLPLLGIWGFAVLVFGGILTGYTHKQGRRCSNIHSFKPLTSP